jgi:uncharacterized protein YukE
MSNPLVAQEDHDTTGYAGIGILDSTTQCVDAIASGDWIEAGIGVASTIVDEFSLYEDPAAALASYGVGWLIEHVHALSEPLDWLAGNPGAIEAHAQTWSNVADAVSAVRQDYAHAMAGDLTTWQGSAADAYRSRATNTGHLLEALAFAADGIRVAITLSGKVVSDVRGKIQKIISNVVGALISWAAELVCTGGLAAPVVAEQAITFIAKWAAKIAELVAKLLKAIKTLMPLLRHLDEIFSTLKEALDAQPASGRSALSRALDGSR